MRSAPIRMSDDKYSSGTTTKVCCRLNFLEILTEVVTWPNTSNLWFEIPNRFKKHFLTMFSNPKFKTALLAINEAAEPVSTKADNSLSLTDGSMIGVLHALLVWLFFKALLGLLQYLLLSDLYSCFGDRQ